VYRNVSTVYLTGGCNTDKPITTWNEEIEIIDKFAYNTNSTVVGVFQVPNCRLIWTDDPNHGGKSEDSLVAYSFGEFIKTADPKTLVFFPMTKTSLLVMKAAEEFLA
jgi:PhoPQ-activated pathogenicity-related protein